MKDTPSLTLKIISMGVCVYFEPPYYGYALNFHFVYLTIPWTRLLSTKSKICLFYLHANAKREIQICSNKHETGLVHFLNVGKIFSLKN